MKKVKKDQKQSNKSIKKQSIEKHIIEIVSSSPTKSFGYKEIAKELGIKDEGRKQLVYSCLLELKQRGLIEEVEHGMFKVVTKGGTLSVRSI